MEMHPRVAKGNTRLNFPGRYTKQESAGTPEPNRRRTAMKLSPVLLLLLFIPTVTMAQRYGRPYNLAGVPTLFLQVNVQKKSHYFSVYDLRKMPRSVVTETDPTTNQTHVYEGVALEQLVPITGLNSETERVEIEFGSHQTQTISAKDLEARTTLIIVDTVDSKPLPVYAPFYFVAKFSGKPALTITNVYRINAKLPDDLRSTK